MKKILIALLLLITVQLHAQVIKSTYWTKDGKAFYSLANNEIVLNQLPSFEKKVIVTKAQLTPSGKTALAVRSFTFYDDDKKILIYTNTKKVWRYDTRGDYWVLNLADN